MKREREREKSNQEPCSRLAEFDSILDTIETGNDNQPIENNGIEESEREMHVVEQDLAILSPDDILSENTTDVDLDKLRMFYVTIPSWTVKQTPEARGDSKVYFVVEVSHERFTVAS